MTDRNAITIRPRIDPRPKRASAKVEARRKNETGRTYRSPIMRRLAGLATRRRAVGLARTAATRLKVPGARLIGPALPVILGAAAAVAAAKVISGKETSQMATEFNNLLFGGADIKARAEKDARERLFSNPAVQNYANLPGNADQFEGIFNTWVDMDVRKGEGRRSLELQERFQTKNEFDLVVDRLVSLFKSAWSRKQVNDSVKQASKLLGVQ